MCFIIMTIHRNQHLSNRRIIYYHTQKHHSNSYWRFSAPMWVLGTHLGFSRRTTGESSLQACCFFFNNWNKCTWYTWCSVTMLLHGRLKTIPFIFLTLVLFVSDTHHLSSLYSALKSLEFSETDTRFPVLWGLVFMLSWRRHQSSPKRPDGSHVQPGP